ncbi:hypothetical protein [Nocardia nova]|uniref:hypothetical protein n=1 Tax=Nocardia nova TaxID=37330 RepID=UPI0011B01B09|nr:hypothetical protein [Nocardia nova]
MTSTEVPPRWGWNAANRIHSATAAITTPVSTARPTAVDNRIRPDHRAVALDILLICAPVRRILPVTARSSPKDSSRTEIRAQPLIPPAYRRPATALGTPFGPRRCRLP